jgi:hypothetical protein
MQASNWQMSYNKTKGSLATISGSHKALYNFVKLESWIEYLPAALWGKMCQQTLIKQLLIELIIRYIMTYDLADSHQDNL